MKLQGDPDGIAALKALHEVDKEGVKFLLRDARTTTDRSAYFRGKDGRKFRMHIEEDGSIVVAPAPPAPAHG